MLKPKEHNAFLQELLTKNTHYKNGDFEVVGQYKNNRDKILLRNKYGDMYCNAWTLLCGYKPSISTAEDKLSYYKNMLLESNKWYREGEFEIISDYINMATDIYVKDKYGICKGRPQCYIKFKPSIQSAIDKTEYYKNKATEIHENKYSYDNLVYNGSDNKVTITCPIHGDFEQQASAHLSGAGCKKCNENTNSFSKKDWTKSECKKLGILYLIKCYNDNEIFYKIGITKTNVRKRFGSKLLMPYKYDIMATVVSDNKKLIWELEKKLKQEHYKYYYLPIIPFSGGATECYLDNKDFIDCVKYGFEKLDESYTYSWLKE